MNTANLKKNDVVVALARIRRELQKASTALQGADSVACHNALEQVQHRAYEAKALFQGEKLPTEDEIGA